jgi:hypothetical protein
LSSFRTNKFSITNTDAGRGTSSTWIGQFQFVGICDVAIIRTEVESVFVLVTQRGGGCGEQFNHHSGRDQTNYDEHKIHHRSLTSNQSASAGRDKHSPSRHGSVHLEDWLLVIGTHQAAKLRQAMAERGQCGKRRKAPALPSGSYRAAKPGSGRQLVACGRARYSLQPVAHQRAGAGFRRSPPERGVPFRCRLRSSLEPHQPRGSGVRGLALTEKWGIGGVYLSLDYFKRLR